MGNESSLFVKEAQIGVDLATGCESADPSSQLSPSEFSCSNFSEFASLDLILAQPLVIGQKRFRPNNAAAEEGFSEDLGNEVCFKRVCISL